MADLFTVSAYAEIFGALLVVGGLGFAILELRRNREQKRRDAAYQIFSDLGSKEFIAGQVLLRNLPEGLSKDELEEKYGDRVEELVWVLSQFEQLATMAANRLVPLDLTFEFFQPSIMNAWRKLRPYINDLRVSTDNSLVYIYFEWMAKRIEAMSQERTADAIVAELEAWRP